MLDTSALYFNVMSVLNFVHSQALWALGLRHYVTYDLSSLGLTLLYNALIR